MKKIKNFSDIPFNEINEWEKENESKLFYENDKGISFHRIKDDDDEELLIISVGDNSPKNTINLIGEQVKMLKLYLDKQII
tara:strand:+ start:85 stop:327 length:243 start_codon:yes stop_codon:yes gene_type:complete